MNNNELIEELLADLCILHNDGLPNLRSDKSISYISEFFNERGMWETGQMIIENLFEDDKEFKNPDLNKVIKYKTVNGDDAEGKVGNLLRRPKEEDAHIQALKALGGKDSDRYKSAMDDLGAEGQPNRDIEGEREKKDDSGEAGGGEEPETGTAFDPKTKGGKDYLENLPDEDPAKPDSMKGDSEETLSAGGVVYPVGGGYYADTPNGEPKYKKATEESIGETPISKLLEGDEVGQTVVKKIANTKGETSTMVVIDDEEQKKAIKNTTPKNISAEQKSARNLLKKLDIETLKIDNPELSDEELEYIQNLSNSIDEFLNNETSDDRKREIAAELKDTYGLTTNTNTTDANGKSVDVKIYIKKNVGGRKLPRSIEKILNKNASKPSTNLVNEFNKYLDEDNQITPNTIGGNSERALKVEFEKAAKPSFRIEDGETKREKVRKNPNANIRQKDPNNPGYDTNGQPLTIIDPVVSEIFKKGTALGDLKESMHSIEGPADGNGNLIPCNTPENKRKHFDFLVNSNESTKKVKQAAQKYIDDPNVSKSDKDKFRNVIKEIDEYEVGMNGVLNKVPSEEATIEVQRLNAKLMDGLHNAYPDIASGMAKQFAENALVTQEIAVGDEVYMPSQGTFPGGDKILVTRNGAVMEAVAGVSVKFGRGSKETQIYGFPGEAQSMANFAEPERKTDETDEQYEERKLDLRTRNGKYVGQEGYLIGVRDDIINDENKFNEVLSQSGLDTVITDKKKLQQITKEIHSEIQRYIEQQQQLGRSGPVIRISLQKHMREWMNQNNTEARFEECIDRNKLIQNLTGSIEGTYTDVNGDERRHSNLNVARKCNPIEFMSLTAFASSVKEGSGMPSLYWNHQSYEDGEYHSQTTNPTDTDMTDLSNWGFNTRMWATSSRDGGGLLATGTGESKYRNKPLKNMEDVE
jgi:hypothetical protein